MTPVSTADKVAFILGLAFLFAILASSAHHFAR